MLSAVGVHIVNDVNGVNVVDSSYQCVRGHVRPALLMLNNGVNNSSRNLTFFQFFFYGNVYYTNSRIRWFKKSFSLDIHRLIFGRNVSMTQICSSMSHRNVNKITQI